MEQTTAVTAVTATGYEPEILLIIHPVASNWPYSNGEIDDIKHRTAGAYTQTRSTKIRPTEPIALVSHGYRQNCQRRMQRNEKCGTGTEEIHTPLNYTFKLVQINEIVEATNSDAARCYWLAARRESQLQVLA